VRFGAFFGLFLCASGRFFSNDVIAWRWDSFESRLPGEPQGAQSLGFRSHRKGRRLVFRHRNATFLCNPLQAFEFCFGALPLFFSFAWQTFTPYTNEGAACFWSRPAVGDNAWNIGKSRLLLCEPSPSVIR
jgi:hypothetical protein